MRRYFFILFIIVCSGLLTGCSKRRNLEKDNTEETGRLISSNQMAEDDISEMKDLAPTAKQEGTKYKYQEMPDLEVGYVSELGYHRAARIRASNPAIIICWNDVLIIGDAIYRRENEIYKRTEEQLQDWFDIADDSNLSDSFQWQNLLIVNYRDEIMILDMDSGQLWIYPFDGYSVNVYQGKIYYKVWNEGIHCMDILNGEIEVIYASEGVSDFMIRDNGDMIISVVNETDSRIWEFWMLSHDEQGDLDVEKIWETDKYKYVEMREFNDRGLFFIGDYYYAVGDGDDLLCLKDSGEREQMMLEEGWASVVGQIIVDEGYFLWDSQMLSEEEKVEILGSWYEKQIRKAVTVVDSISYYDFQGNKQETWQLIENEMLEAGYHLESIVYDNGEIIAFYENEELDDLFISKVQIL